MRKALCSGPAAAQYMSYRQAVRGYHKIMTIIGHLNSDNPLCSALLPAADAIHNRMKATAPSEARFNRDFFADGTARNDRRKAGKIVLRSEKSKSV